MDEAELAVFADTVSAGVPGLAVFGASFEDLVDALKADIGRITGAEQAMRLGVPPVISRKVLERTGYVESFPHLLGAIHTFNGNERQWRAAVGQPPQGVTQWHTSLDTSDLMVLPAACYHVYPRLADAELDHPVAFDVTAYCFRDECTAEPGRLRSFRMRELVRVDAPEPVRRWRDGWIESAGDWLRSLDLRPRAERASDQFFGAAQRLTGTMQRTEQLKWELVVEVADGVSQAVVSCNCHKDHFAAEFGFRMRGSVAHTACVAFGLERLALAVLRRHGPDPASWPVPR